MRADKDRLCEVEDAEDAAKRETPSIAMLDFDQHRSCSW